MLKQIGSFVIGFLCCALIVSAMGAQFQQDDYQKACIGFQAEGLAIANFAGTKPVDQARVDAAKKRRLYWLAVMEKFKP